MNKGLVIGVIVGLIIGLLVGYFLFNKNINSNIDKSCDDVKSSSTCLNGVCTLYIGQKLSIYQRKVSISSIDSSYVSFIVNNKNFGTLLANGRDIHWQDEFGINATKIIFSNNKPCGVQFEANEILPLENQSQVDEKTRCESGGGKWQKDSTLGGNIYWFCSLPTSDAGKTCASSSQCQSKECIAPQGASVGSYVNGTCYGWTHRYSANTVENGKVAGLVIE